MLYNVLHDVAKDTGLHPIQQRETLLRHLQNAADDMHTLLDCNGIQREVTLAVMPNSLISLPYFVGKLIGMRRVTNDDLIDVHSIGFPRFVRNTQHYKLNGWRVIGDSAIRRFPEADAAQLTFSCPVIENAVVTVCGDTNTSESFEESVTMDALVVQGNAVFGKNITKIASMSNRTANITIADLYGNTLAILYNNQIQTFYKIVDVSEVYWSVDTTNEESLIDVWYKLPKKKFVKDTDSFYAGDEYDNAWYFMALSYFHVASDVKKAAEYRAFAVSSMRVVKQDNEGKIEKQLTFGPNKYLEAQDFSSWK